MIVFSKEESFSNLAGAVLINSSHLSLSMQYFPIFITNSTIKIQVRNVHTGLIIDWNLVFKKRRFSITKQFLGKNNTAVNINHSAIIILIGIVNISLTFKLKFTFYLLQQLKINICYINIVYY